MAVTTNVSSVGAIHDTEAKALYDCCLEVPPRGLVVEVGCQLGRSSSLITQLAHAIGFHSVHIDPYTEHADDYLIDWVRMMYRVGGAHAHAFTLLCMRTEQADWHLARFGTIDFAFIDGDHEAPAVEIDLRLVANKVRRQGLLAVHDYTHEGLPGVKQAMAEYLKSGEWEEVGLFHSLGIWRRK